MRLGGWDPDFYIGNIFEPFRNIIVQCMVFADFELAYAWCILKYHKQAFNLRIFDKNI
jgi:hypothetical protein